jgi:hypothetical protein
MAKEGRHIDAAPPPIELDMLSFIPYTANRYGIIRNTLLSILLLISSWRTENARASSPIIKKTGLCTDSVHTTLSWQQGDMDELTSAVLLPIHVQETAWPW